MEEEPGIVCRPQLRDHCLWKQSGFTNTWLYYVCVSHRSRGELEGCRVIIMIEIIHHDMVAVCLF